MMTGIWFSDLENFMTIHNYYVIIPTAGMSLEEKLNALVRFFIYLGVLLAIIKNDYKYVFFGIVAAVLSVVLYNHELKQKAKAERFLEKKDLTVVDNRVCSRSTVENPFGNPSVFDLGANPDRPAACSLENPEVKVQVEENFNERLFRDVGDLYGKMSSQRQFYTMPNTTIPNDQTGFAEWLFGKGRTCKEGNGDQCYANQYRYIGYQ